MAMAPYLLGIAPDRQVACLLHHRALLLERSLDSYAFFRTGFCRIGLPYLVDVPAIFQVESYPDWWCDLDRLCRTSCLLPNLLPWSASGDERIDLDDKFSRKHQTVFDHFYPVNTGEVL